MNAARVRIDGRALATLPYDDRGLSYGDGLFETVLLSDGCPVWWQAHLDRLQRGAARLGLVAPEESRWRGDLDALLEDHPQATSGAWVARLQLTAGSASRGYARPASTVVRRVVSLAPAPDSRSAAEHGLRLRWCELRLAIQPALAGIKHSNRLEQVLARAEWDDPAIDEGVLCDHAGNVVSAVTGNLAWLDEQGWHTPPVDRAGIAGICRQQGLERGWFDQRHCRPEQLQRCRGLLVCNSVRGILPVARLGEHPLSLAEVRLLQSALAAIEPAFDHAFLRRTA